MASPSTSCRAAIELKLTMRPNFFRIMSFAASRDTANVPSTFVIKVLVATSCEVSMDSATPELMPALLMATSRRRTGS